MPDFHPETVSIKVEITEFKSAFPEGGIITYPEFYDSGNRKMGVTVWHSDRNSNLYFVNQPMLKPDYLPWYVDLHLEISNGKLIAYPKNNTVRGTVTTGIFILGIMLVVIGFVRKDQVRR